MSAAMTNVIASTVSGSLNVKLHPLVIINMSDHVVRTQVQNGKNCIVLGALMGKHSGRMVEVFNSFEFKLMGDEGDEYANACVTSIEEGAVTLDSAYFFDKKGQLEKVFPDDDFLGWYCAGGMGEGAMSPTPWHIDIHRQVTAWNESPVFLHLTSSSAVVNDLPLALYESVLDTSDSSKAPTLFFVSIPYTIVSGEAERVSVEHIAHSGETDSSELSKAAISLRGQHSAVSMLRTRIEILVKYARQVQEGTLPMDHSIIRELAELCNRLPALNRPEISSSYLAKHADVMLLMYLASMTKGCHVIYDLLRKLNVISNRRGSSVSSRCGRGTGRHVGSSLNMSSFSAPDPFKL